MFQLKPNNFSKVSNSLSSLVKFIGISMFISALNLLP